MMYDLYNMLLDSVCQNFVEDFCIYVHQWYWAVHFFFCGIFVCFWYQGDGSFMNEFGSLPSSAIFQRSLSRIVVSSSLNFWQNSPMKPFCPGLLFVGRFFITVLISMLVMMGLLRFLFLPDSVLEGYTFLRICPSLPSCPFYWHIIAHGTLL